MHAMHVQEAIRLTFQLSFIMEISKGLKITHSLHTRWIHAVHGNIALDAETIICMASVKESV
jgi:hypothetical protein